MKRWLVLAAMVGSACGQATTAAKPRVHPVFPGGESTALGHAVAQVLADPEVARAHVGVAVTAMDGTPLFGLNEGQLFRPASNAKLFTTAAAMAVLGPEATVSTRVMGSLDETRGLVTGDLVLKGEGDGAFGTDDVPYVSPTDQRKDAVAKTNLKDLEELADQLVAKGVKHVTGGVVGDDMAFPWEPYPQGWEADDLLWGYGAPVSALSIADNQLKLTLTPFGATIEGAQDVKKFYKTHNPHVVLEDFGVPFYTVQSGVVQGNGGASGVDVERRDGQSVLRLYGTLDPQAKPDVEEIAITDPALFAARALQGILVRRGIVFGADARSRHREVDMAQNFFTELQKVTAKPFSGSAMFACTGQPEAGTELAAHESPPLHEDVKFTLKVSQNLHAELLLRRLYLDSPCGQSSTLDGAKVARAVLLRAGIDGDDFVFYDGSGLSTHDLVTPRATTQLLVYASTQPWFAQWKAALPIGGIDGSLSSRYKDGPLKGHVFAKTGTLGESRALSGYVDCASGKTVAFSIFVDTHLPGHSEGDVIDKIVAAIAADN